MQDRLLATTTTDIEQNTPLLGDVFTYFDTHLNHLDNVRVLLINLDRTLATELNERRIAQFQVDATSMALLALLQTLHQQITASDRNLSQQFSRESYLFSENVSEQLAWYQHLFHLYTREANESFERGMMVFMCVYVLFAVLAIASLVTLIAIGPHAAKNSQIGEIIGWVFAISGIIAAIPTDTILLLLIVVRVCEPSIDDYLRNIPPPAQNAPARELTNALSTLFNHYKPRDFTYFMRQPEVNPRTFTELGEKLCALNLSTGQLLTAEEIAPVLSAYFHGETPSEDFIEKLLNIRIHLRRGVPMLLRGFIAKSGNSDSEEATIVAANALTLLGDRQYSRA